MALDATPLLGTRTGVGRYVEHLFDEFAGIRALDVRAAAFSVRGRAALADLPAAVTRIHRPVPARLLHQAWLHGDMPPAEWLVGRVDVVHGTNFVLPPPRRAAGVVTIHDLTFLRYPELVDTASLAYRELVPRALSRAAAVLTPSQAMADELAGSYRAPSELIRVTPLGIDPSWFGMGSARPAGFPAQYVLAVGTLEPRKGLDVLLAAYRSLLADEPTAPPLVLVGAAGWGPAIDMSGLTVDQVILPGYVSDERLRELVAGASLLAFPSRYEGFGLPPLEALAAGTPVVASDLPAVREVVGGFARLAKPGDADALADALRGELAHPLSPTQRQAAREYAAGFTWRRCAELTRGVYKEIV